MSKQIAIIPLADVARAGMVEAKGRSMAQVQADEGCDYILNSYFYNMATGRPVGHLKIDGGVLARASWSCWGLTWDVGNDLRMVVIPASGGRSWVSGVELLTPGKGPGAKLAYDGAYGGKRGRSAVLLAGDRLVLYCSGDGSGDAKTPEGLRDELAELGRRYAASKDLRALGLDSGGSSQCRFPGGSISSARRVAGYFCVWLKKKEGEPMKGKFKVTPSVGVNVRSGPGSGYGKVGAYACGTVVAVDEVREGWGKTRLGWVSMGYLEAVSSGQEADRVTDTGLVISRDFIPPGRKNRPGKANPCKYITVHETGNTAQGADAQAHASYLKSGAAVEDKVSWHYTVDGHGIVQHLPDTESAYHAGDGADGPGNGTSIGIEICVNQGGDFAAAQANAAALVRLLMAEHGISVEHVVQHNRWNGKDCPYTIRHTAGAWEAFLGLCAGEQVPWYAEAQAWAKSQGISDGARPDSPATRAEVWEMLRRFGGEGA